MKTYDKPFVMVNNDLAEGVYAASGAGNNTVISSKYTLTRKYAGDQYNMYEQYIIKFPDLPESGVQNKISVDLTVNGSGVTSAWAMNTGSYSYNGKSITINLDGWQNWMEFQVECSAHDFTLS